MKYNFNTWIKTIKWVKRQTTDWDKYLQIKYMTKDHNEIRYTPVRWLNEKIVTVPSADEEKK